LKASESETAQLTAYCGGTMIATKTVGHFMTKTNHVRATSDWFRSFV